MTHVLRLLCLFCIFFSSYGFPYSDSDIVHLSQSPTWKKLLHIDGFQDNPNTTKSAISTSDFFLSEEGNDNPHAELKATLNALLKEPSMSDNESVQCRFPARFIWLKRQFPEQLNTIKRAKCSDYTTWTRNGKTHSLSIVYASGYLGNPASFYGHTLLKLNASEDKASTPLVDISVNYGAVVPQNENPVVYIAKGIFGGYDGAFSDLAFYHHNHNYGETELRDLWEYELNLTKEQVDFVLAHTWEVLGKSYTYYFFRENCGYRMAELLQILDGVHIVPHNPIWTMPQTIIQNLEQGEIDGHPLVRTVKYTPSRQRRFYQAFADITLLEKSAVTFYIENEFQFSEQFETASVKSKHRIIDTLLHYFQYLRVQNKTPEPRIEKGYQSLLAKRFLLPPGKPTLQTKTPLAPHKGRPPSLTRIAWLHGSENANTTELTLRPAYYDQLDAQENHIPNASLKMGQVILQHSDGNFALRQLDLVDIQSLNTQATGLPGDSNLAWKLKAGWERPNFNCSDCLAFTVRADRGYSAQLTDTFLIAGYLGASASEGNGPYGHFQLQSTLELQGKINDKMNVFASAQKIVFADGDARSEERYELSLRYSLSEEWDIRAHFRKQDVSQFGASLGYYW